MYYTVAVKNPISKLSKTFTFFIVLFLFSNAFGQSELTNTKPKLIKGDVFIIEKGVTSLPRDFSKLTPITSIFVSEINVSDRAWNNGFPDLPEIYEWFAIEYTATIRAKQDGNFKFRLVSDDGAKLYVDQKLIIDNDGTHSFLPVSGSAKLAKGEYNLKVQFFQGPRYEAGIQLFVKKDGAKETIFPGDDFEIIGNSNREASTETNK